jgi:hypothetical protein
MVKNPSTNIFNEEEPMPNSALETPSRSPTEKLDSAVLSRQE